MVTCGSDWDWLATWLTIIAADGDNGREDVAELVVLFRQALYRTEMRRL